MSYLLMCCQHLTAHEGHLSDDSPDIESLLDVLSETTAEVDIPAAACCVGCGRLTILQGEQRQRSWGEVMTSPSRPTWYRRIRVTHNACSPLQRAPTIDA